MFRVLISCCLLCVFTCQIALAQTWIPEDVKSTTILIERFKYQNPDDLELELDDKNEDACKVFVKNANDSLKQYNEKLATAFKDCKLKYELAVTGKIDEKYEDTEKYRYVLKRDLYYGQKKVLPEKAQEKSEAKKAEDKKTADLKSESFFAYRYYFYDREEDEDLPTYYFSGDQWSQVERLVFWLNNVNASKKEADK